MLGGAGQANGSCVVARSLVWPGAVAISSGRQYSNIYVGYAISYNKAGMLPFIWCSIQMNVHIIRVEMLMM